MVHAPSQHLVKDFKNQLSEEDDLAALFENAAESYDLMLESVMWRAAPWTNEEAQHRSN